MNYHIIAFVAGYILDLILGDPYWLYHPIKLIGNLIYFIEKKLNKEGLSDEKKKKNGGLMVITVIILTVVVVMAILIGGYIVNVYLGMVIEGIMTYQILATKCLKVESMKVYYKLKENDLEGARNAVAMIVGRDTKCLDENGVSKAAVETIAENTSDGVIAPMIYLALGGPILGFLYKAINTMDSMVGYKNDKYLYFGRIAAKLDDIVNFIPARISAVLMILSSYLLGIMPIYIVENEVNKHVFSGKNAFRIFKRDRFNHASPNSAQTEAVCAGSLGVRLAGDASYFGKIVKKPFIGDACREIEYEDIKRANMLLYVTAFACEIISLVFLLAGYMIVVRGAI